jgi:predicted MarR family transcription regulator
MHSQQQHQIQLQQIEMQDREKNLRDYNLNNNSNGIHSGQSSLNSAQALQAQLGNLTPSQLQQVCLFTLLHDDDDL